MHLPRRGIRRIAAPGESIGLDPARPHPRDRMRRPVRPLPPLSAGDAADRPDRIPRPPASGPPLSTREQVSRVRRFADQFERQWRKLSYTGSIAGIAIIISWLGLWLIRRDDSVGLLLTSVATLLTLVAF